MRDSIEISGASNTFEENKNKLLGEIQKELEAWFEENPSGLDSIEPTIKTIDLKNTKIRDSFIAYLNTNTSNNLVQRLKLVFRKSHIQSHNGKYEGFGIQMRNIKDHIYDYIVAYKKGSDKLIPLDILLSDEILKNSQSEIDKILKGTTSLEKQIKEISRLIKTLLAQKHHDEIRDALLPGELID